MGFCVQVALRAMALLRDCRSPSLVEGEFVCFRGTQTIGEILRDLQFSLAPTRGGCVHSGFLKLYRSRRDSLRVPQTPAIVSGHSMGGAQALLHAYRLHLDGHDIDGVYVVGTPKMCDATFRRAYDRALGSRTFCIDNPHDVVTHLPPFSKYDRPGRRIECPFDFNSYAENHSLENYMDALEDRYASSR